MIARFLGITLTALLAAPLMLASPDAAAEPPPGELDFAGVIGLSGGIRHANSTDDPEDSLHAMFAGEGYVNVPFGDSFSVQLDVQSEIYLDHHDEAPQGTHMFGGHLSMRDPERYLVGIFAGGGLASFDDGTGRSHGGFTTGGEFQVYFDNLTFYTQGGYADFDVDDEEGFVTGWFIGPEFRLFPTDDSTLEAGFTFGETSHFIDGNDDGEIWNWRAGGKIRLCDRFPIYGTALYQGGRYDATDEGDHAWEHSGMMGLTFLFGANGENTLKRNDRHGATLRMPTLPARTAAWAEGID